MGNGGRGRRRGGEVQGRVDWVRYLLGFGAEGLF